jgi:HD-GYP domain-containing protein (c-di-GMP phosphodiesterase class II)
VVGGYPFGKNPTMRLWRRGGASVRHPGENERPRDGDAWWPGATGRLRVLLVVVAASALVVTAVTVHLARDEIRERPATFLALLALTLALTLVTVEMHAGARVSVAGIGLLAVGFELGAGAAVLAAILLAFLHGARTRAEPARTAFNAGALVLASAAAAATFAGASALGLTVFDRLLPAFAAGCVFWALNAGLLALAMAAADREPFGRVWRERFGWLTPHYLAFGPLALASIIALDVAGAVGLLAFLLPPALVMLSVRQYLERTRSAVEEIRQRNRDLSDLFEFASGLATRAHDGKALVAYAEKAIAALAGGQAVVGLGRDAAGGIPLVSGGTKVGVLRVKPEEGQSRERWRRLRDAIVPQLATALEGTVLVEQVRKTHLDTIAALSRSMEAKDLYTGGHTERVAELAVAVGERLDLPEPDLDAIAIGALLHDIGKIGIPERILHKPGPLDESEWEIMKRHPVISEYILSGIDFPPIVRAIARWSHERVDGNGYPDGLAGADVPLPAQIVFVADAFDAITSDRPYRPARGTLAALEEIRRNAGTQFSREVVDALEQVARDRPELLAPREPEPVRSVA